MSVVGQPRHPSGPPQATDILGVHRHVSKVPIPDLPNATAYRAKRNIANPPAIAVVAGHAIERAARLLKNPSANRRSRYRS
jgi:hypothetical protein